MTYVKAMRQHSLAKIAENRSSDRYLSCVRLPSTRQKEKENINTGYVCHEVPTHRIVNCREYY